MRLFSYTTGGHQQLPTTDDSSSNGGRRSNAESLLRSRLAFGIYRLAFGIYRLDISMSIILDERPLLSFDELCIPLPGAHERARVPTSLHDDATTFHDVVCALLDEDAILPMLEAEDVELLALAMHEIDWRQQHCTTADNHQHHHQDPPPPVSLDTGDRRLTAAMIFTVLDRLINPFGIIAFASAASAASADINEKQHSQLLNTQLAVHLARLRLLAPLPLLHSLPYSLFGLQPKSEAVVKAAKRWAAWSAGGARRAVRYACEIYTLLLAQQVQNERGHRCPSMLPPDTTTDLWAGMALHASAITIWVYAGCHPAGSIEAGEAILVDLGRHREREALEICAENSARILTELMRVGENLKVTLEGSMGGADGGRD